MGRICHRSNRTSRCFTIGIYCLPSKDQDQWKSTSVDNGRDEFIIDYRISQLFSFKLIDFCIFNDQYVLYLDKETRFVEWLHFTLRDKFNFIHPTAQFTDFKTINGIVAPFNQYITMGTPEERGTKFHENRYQWIQFGTERVER